MSTQSPVILVLGSKSPARLKTLRSAGVEPEVIVTDVDEDAVVAALPPDACPSEVVIALATAKAQAAADALIPQIGDIRSADRYIVLGADSMLHINGRLVGKPHTPQVAKQRIQEMRDTEGVLWTGHALVPVEKVEGRWTVGAPVVASEDTIVHFGEISDEEIDAYIATGEPLQVAGSFTIDGLGGPFIRGITGDPHSVVGVSLPVLRHLASQLDVFWPDLWEGRNSL